MKKLYLTKKRRGGRFVILVDDGIYEILKRLFWKGTLSGTGYREWQARVKGDMWLGVTPPGFEYEGKTVDILRLVGVYYLMLSSTDISVDPRDIEIIRKGTDIILTKREAAVVNMYKEKIVGDLRLENLRYVE